MILLKNDILSDPTFKEATCQSNVSIVICCYNKLSSIIFINPPQTGLCVGKKK